MYYNLTTFRGEWRSAGAYDDTELYDYVHDKWETTNFAAEPSHAAVAARLRAALLEQFAPAGSAALDAPLLNAGVAQTVCNQTTWLSSMARCAGIPDLVQNFTADSTCRQGHAPKTANGTFFYNATLDATTLKVLYWEAPGATSCAGPPTTHTERQAGTCLDVGGAIHLGTMRIDCGAE